MRNTFCPILAYAFQLKQPNALKKKKKGILTQKVATMFSNNPLSLSTNIPSDY